MYSHLLVPLDGDDRTQAALHPSAAMARSFDATLILVGCAAALASLDVDTIYAPDVVAVRTEVDLPSSLERVGDNLPEPLAVYAGEKWQPYADAWSGDLLVFGPASTPEDYVVGGTMLIDQRHRPGLRLRHHRRPLVGGPRTRRAGRDPAPFRHRRGHRPGRPLDRTGVPPG